jgi:NADPH:quinone reductase-like Zn-dependent oxidoreductase
MPSTLPLVPGIDGVGRDPEGGLRYFLLPDSATGTMADHTVIDTRRSVLLPSDTDPVAVAAALNPAMSSWIALRRRIEFPAGASVLVLGATGNAGRMAIQVARHLGAGRVVAAGRDPDRLAALAELGADVAVPLESDEFGGAAAAWTSCWTTYGVSRPPGRWSRSSPIARIADEPFAGCRSARSPGRPPPFRRPRCAPPACKSWAASRDR